MPKEHQERTEPAAVPHAEYARTKELLYHRIDILRERAERAETALLGLVDLHHRTLTGSKLHDPENIDWPECPCKTCEGIRLMLPEQATDALASYKAQRAKDAEVGSAAA